MYIHAVHLGILVDASKELTSLDNYINDELIKRLNIFNTNYVKLSKKYTQIVNVIKSYHNIKVAINLLIKLLNKAKEIEK